MPNLGTRGTPKFIQRFTTISLAESFFYERLSF
jgi:hypothetical protein